MAMKVIQVTTCWGLRGTGAEARVLRGDADGADVRWQDRIMMQRAPRGGRGEAELLGAEEGRDDDVAPRLELPVGLEDDAAPEIVQDEHWCASPAPAPRDPACWMLVKGERRCRRRAADQDDVGVGLRDTGRDRPDPASAPASR